MRKPLLLLCVLLVFILSACKITISMNIPKDSSPSPSPADTPDIAIATLPPIPDDLFGPETSKTGPQNTGLLGSVDGNTYTNEALGLTATIPDGWEVADEEEMSILFGISADYMEETTGLKSDSTMYIFYCSKNGTFSADLNPNINISVSNKTIFMSVFENENGLNFFLEQYRPLIEKLYTNAKVDLTGEMGIKVGANEYVVIHINADYEGTHITQDQYFLHVNDYAIFITETYFDNADKAACDSFLESMRYDQ